MSTAGADTLIVLLQTLMIAAIGYFVGFAVATTIARTISLVKRWLGVR